MSELIIFDNDGTLVNSDPIWIKVILQLMEERGLCPIEARKHMIPGLGLTALFEHIGGQMNADLSDIPFVDINNKYIDIIHELEATEGTLCALEALDQRLMVASNAPSWIVSAGLKALNIDHHFEAVYSAYDVGEVFKPDPKVFLHVMEKHKVPAEKTLIVEDSVSGVKAAVAAKAPVIGFVGASINPDESKELLHKAGASEIITDMSQLLDVL